MLKLEKIYTKACYQLRLFYKGEEVLSTGDDYIYCEKEMIRKVKLLKVALPKHWEVTVIEWKGYQLNVD